MADRLSAEIIVFPRRVAESSPIEDPQLRLQRAVAALDDALTLQRAAIAEWQSGLARLRSSVGALDLSLRRYQKTLATPDGQVEIAGPDGRGLPD